MAITFTCLIYTDLRCDPRKPITCLICNGPCFCNTVLCCYIKYNEFNKDQAYGCICVQNGLTIRRWNNASMIMLVWFAHAKEHIYRWKAAICIRYHKSIDTFTNESGSSNYIKRRQKLLLLALRMKRILYFH